MFKPIGVLHASLLARTLDKYTRVARTLEKNVLLLPVQEIKVVFLLMSGDAGFQYRTSEKTRLGLLHRINLHMVLSSAFKEKADAFGSACQSFEVHLSKYLTPSTHSDQLRSHFRVHHPAAFRKGHLHCHPPFLSWRFSTPCCSSVQPQRNGWYLLHSWQPEDGFEEDSSQRYVEFCGEVLDGYIALHLSLVEVGGISTKLLLAASNPAIHVRRCILIPQERVTDIVVESNGEAGSRCWKLEFPSSFANVLAHLPSYIQKISTFSNISKFDNLRARLEELCFWANPDHLEVFAPGRTEALNHNVLLLDLITASSRGTEAMPECVKFHVLKRNQVVCRSAETWQDEVTCMSRWSVPRPLVFP